MKMLTICFLVLLTLPWFIEQSDAQSDLTCQAIAASGYHLAKLQCEGDSTSYEGAQQCMQEAREQYETDMESCAPVVAARAPRSHAAPSNPTQPAGANWSVNPRCTVGGANCNNKVGHHKRVALRAGVNRRAGTGKFLGHFTYSWSAHYERPLPTRWVACTNYDYRERGYCGILRTGRTSGGNRVLTGGAGRLKAYWVSPRAYQASGKVRITVTVTHESGTAKTGTYTISFP
jgi:hypothetical protein